jgi:hypothetical protein
MRHLLPLLLFAPLASAAEESPAIRIAAALIRERAHEQSGAGHILVAAQLDALSRALASGQVTLAEAAQVVQIALAGTPAAAPAGAAARPAEPPVTAAQVTAVLDGEPPAPAGTAPPAGAAPIITTHVLAAGRPGDSKTLLVMIGAGKDQQVVPNQRFAVRRGETRLGVLSVTEVRDTMAISVAIPGTIPAGAEIKEGDVVESLAP